MRLLYRSRIRRSAGHGRTCWVSALLVLGWPMVVRATPPDASPPLGFTFGVGECPEPAEVERQMMSLVPAERYDLLRRDVRVEVEDLGDSYRVTVVKGDLPHEKVYSDARRDCVERARFAAVFAVLAVMPPSLMLEQPAPPKPVVEPPPAPLPPPPAPKPRPKTIVPRAPLFRLEGSGLFLYAPPILDAPELDSWGGELRAALGRGVLSATAGVAYLSRAEFDLRRVHAEASRVPMSAGLRVRGELGAWSVVSDLGFLAVWERVRATNLARTESPHAVDVGVRSAVSVAYGSRVLAPFVTTFAWFVPSPRDISTAPRGMIGNMPCLSIGAAFGVSLGL